MYIKIENYENNTTRVIDYPGTIKLFLGLHFGAWGFYSVTKAAKDVYHVTNKFDGVLLHTISKAKKRDIEK